MHPEHQLGIGSGVACPRRETAELDLRRPRDPRMHGAHELARPLRLGLRAEGHQIERAQRADQPSPQVSAIVRVLHDSRRNKGMCHLQQHRGPTAEKRGHR